MQWHSTSWDTCRKATATESRDHTKSETPATSLPQTSPALTPAGGLSTLARGWSCLPTAAAPPREGERSPGVERAALLLGAKMPAKTGPCRSHKSGSRLAQEPHRPAIQGHSTQLSGPCPAPAYLLGDRGQEPTRPTAHPDSRLLPLLNSHKASLRVRAVQSRSRPALLSECVA